MKQDIDNHFVALQGFLERMLFKPPASAKVWSQQETQELYTYAYHFYRNGKFGQACDFFETLTTIDRFNSIYRKGLAASYKMLNDYENALDNYIVAVMLEPNDPMIHAHAADCCFALGQTERGLMAIESAEQKAAGKEEFCQVLSQLALIKEAWSNKTIDHSK